MLCLFLCTIGCTNQAYDGEGAPTYYVGDWIADCEDESDEEPSKFTLYK